MDNNTAQNNPQFTYPDFSNKQGGNATPPAAPVANPATTPIPVPATPAQNTTPPTPVVSDDKKQQEEKVYVSQPTPLPKLEKKEEVKSAETQAIPEPTAQVLTDAAAPLPSSSMTLGTLGPVRESLDDIMPEHKGPRAGERKPKENNLANPVNVAKKPKGDLVRASIETKNGNYDASNDVMADPNVTFDSQNYNMQDLLALAVNKNASDLHISVGYPPVLRIDGELEDVGERIISPQDSEELILSVLNDEKKELLEVNREVDFAYTYQGSVTARFRINAYYSMKNLSAAFRLIPSRVRTVEELMLPQLYHQFAKMKQGLVLITGPTGHGKSTTLAAILEDINRTRFCHIVTIEDPVEYVFEGKKALIDQREMNDDTHSWEIALRSALRQDPDVILVGEMRDYETISSAITLAETGHLVFATLHTNSASQTIDRIIDVFPENQQQQVRTQLSNILEAVVAQRLIPLDKGGRRAVSEILLANPAVGNLIREGKTHQVDNIIRTSSDIGMVSLERSLVNLVREGAISVQKAQEYAVFPEEVVRLLKV